jgi:hypothetical protein
MQGVQTDHIDPWSIQLPHITDTFPIGHLPMGVFLHVPFVFSFDFHTWFIALQTRNRCQMDVKQKATGHHMIVLISL